MFWRFMGCLFFVLLVLSVADNFTPKWVVPINIIGAAWILGLLTKSHTEGAS